MWIVFFALVMLTVLTCCSGCSSEDTQDDETSEQRTPDVVPPEPGTASPIPSGFQTYQELVTHMETFTAYTTQDEKEWYKFVREQNDALKENIADDGNFRNELLNEIREIQEELQTQEYYDEFEFLTAYLHYLHQDLNIRGVNFGRTRAILEDLDESQTAVVHAGIVVIAPELRDVWEATERQRALPLQLVTTRLRMLLLEKQNAWSDARELCSDIIAQFDTQELERWCKRYHAQSLENEGRHAEADKEWLALAEEHNDSVARCHLIAALHDDDRATPEIVTYLDTYASPDTYSKEIYSCSDNPPIWDEYNLNIYVFDMNAHKEFLVEDAFRSWASQSNMFSFDFVRNVRDADITINVNNGPIQNQSGLTRFSTNPAPSIPGAHPRIKRAEILIDATLSSDAFEVEAKRQAGFALGLSRGSTQNAVMATGQDITGVDIKTLQELYSS